MENLSLLPPLDKQFRNTLKRFTNKNVDIIEVSLLATVAYLSYLNHNDFMMDKYRLNLQLCYFFTENYYEMIVLL